MEVLILLGVIALHIYIIRLTIGLYIEWKVKKKWWHYALTWTEFIMTVIALVVLTTKYYNI